MNKFPARNNGYPMLFLVGAIAGGLGCATSPVMAQAAPDAPQASEQIIVVAPYTTVKKKIVGHEKLGANVYVITAVRPVSYADLDLTKASDVVLLEKDIRAAAINVCQQLDRKYPTGMYPRVGVTQDCVKSATDEAMIMARRVVVGVKTDVRIAYPKEVGLIYEELRGFVYRRAPGGQPLYVYDLDHDGRSVCNTGCLGERPPVYAPCSDKPVGAWTVIKREYSFCQWAYKGHPLYTFYKDTPNGPQGQGESAVWHILPYTSQPG